MTTKRKQLHEQPLHSQRMIRRVQTKLHEAIPKKVLSANRSMVRIVLPHYSACGVGHKHNFAAKEPALFDNEATSFYPISFYSKHSHFYPAWLPARKIQYVVVRRHGLVCRPARNPPEKRREKSIPISPRDLSRPTSDM